MNFTRLSRPRCRTHRQALARGRVITANLIISSLSLLVLLAYGWRAAGVSRQLKTVVGVVLTIIQQAAATAQKEQQ